MAHIARTIDARLNEYDLAEPAGNPSVDITTSNVTIYQTTVATGSV